MAALRPELRKDLERAIIKARNLVVADVTDRLKELNVHEGKRGALSESQAQLRVRLRAHGKQIGDVRNSQSDAQQIDRLVQECAYEQWHRMIFVRFLAENEFLIDPEYGQSVSMEALVEIAEESKADPWVLGGQFASASLPAIFRNDDPLLELRQSQETQVKLNNLLNSLPAEVFTADDSLGWVYQFWQSEEKDRVNAFGDKINGRTLPAVTQLFTEHYMVLFLLHNTLGAWHAGKVLAANPSLAADAKDEAELRRAVALQTAGGYEFEYLRFVREPATAVQDPEGMTAISRWSSEATPPEHVAPTDLIPEGSQPLAGGKRSATTGHDVVPADSIPEGSQPDALASLRDANVTSQQDPVAALRLPPANGLDASGMKTDACGMEEQGKWRPMGGTFSGWPKTAAELKVLDPSCGSGHFLAAALELLVRLRMHEEGLSIEAAVEAVLRDNLFGLEIDPRCTQIAAFNVAMAVWKLTGPKPLPPMRNIACSGIPLGNSRDEWMKSLKVAMPSSNLGFQWGQLYDMFSKADTLGSLINPQRYLGASFLATQEQLNELTELISTAISKDRNSTDEQQELAAAAQGLTRATELLSGRYTLVITNVPYLGRGKQDDELKKYLDTQYALGKADLATAFVLRCLEFCIQGGSTALVTPQNWLFLTTYKKLRETLLERRQWDFMARLGAGAFETIGGHVVNVALLGLTAQEANDQYTMAGFDVSGAKAPFEKDNQLISSRDLKLIPQSLQRNNPDSRIATEIISSSPTLRSISTALAGCAAGDSPRFIFSFWEASELGSTWEFHQSTVSENLSFGGKSEIILWEKEQGAMAALAASVRHMNHIAQNWLRGKPNWGRRGVVVSQMGSLSTTLYTGDRYDCNCVALVPNEDHNVPAIWEFCSSGTFEREIRKLNQKVNVTPGAILDVPFDLKHWQLVAAENYPNGLPEPESDDPTQWLFHGCPEQSNAPLQVTVARLLGYRWPAELDSEMRLSQRARALVARCVELDEFVDDDGIVCIPSVRGEDPASDRLLRLLNACGESSIPRGSQPLAGGQRSATTGNDNAPTDTHPEGMTAISRWSSEATPPEHDALTDSIPTGSQANALSSLRDEHDDDDADLGYHSDPVVALRLPPANSSNPFGVNTDASAGDPVVALRLPPANGLDASSMNETNAYGMEDHEPEASAFGSRFGDIDAYLRDRFFQEHCELFHQRPFIWHIWDGRKDGFSALVNYHKLAGLQGKKLLENLTYSYLGDWITRQEAGVKNNESGADDRLLAAKELQDKLQAILHGEPPYDIFVRWKPLHEQPIGWTPDINDGVRMNIRPFMSVELTRGRKGAGVLRYPPKIKWTKDRGKEPKRPIKEYPWFWSWDEKTQDFAGGDRFTGDRWNDLHYSIATKQAARDSAKNREAQS